MSEPAAAEASLHDLNVPKGDDENISRFQNKHGEVMTPALDFDAVQEPKVQDDEAAWSKSKDEMGSDVATRHQRHKWKLTLALLLLMLLVVAVIVVVPAVLVTASRRDEDDDSDSDDVPEIPPPTPPPQTMEETSMCEAATGPLTLDRDSPVRVVPNTSSGVAYLFMIGKASQLQAEFFPCDGDEEDYYQMKVSVFTGSCDDRHMVRDQHVVRCDEGVTWFGERDKKYVLQVETVDQVEEFNMVVFERSVSNDVCRGAFGPVRLNTPVDISTDAASVSSGEDPRAYFFFIGKGKQVAANFPCEQGETNDWDIPWIQVSLFTGTCDGSRHPVVEYHDMRCGEGGLTWFADLGEVYTFKIVTRSPISAGTFDLVVLDDMPENDLCTGAVALAWPADTPTTIMATGSNAQATHFDTVFEDWPPWCTYWYGFDFKSVGGIWYTVVGRNAGISASVRALNGTDAAYSIFVYKLDEGEDCESSLECVKDESGFWFGEAGVTYYIYVTSKSQRGPLSLTLEEFVVSQNDHCPGAEALLLDSPSLVSTKNATVEYVRDAYWNDFPESLPGVFYEIVGTGSVLKASSPCTGSKNISPRIYVFAGVCGRMSKVGERVVCDPDSSAYWDSVEGEVYHILFQARRDETNELVVSEARPALNDLCLGAVGPLEYGSVTKGNMSAAREFYVDRRRLSPVMEPYRLYYTVLGTGDWAQATVTCDGGRYELSIFSGTCEHLVPTEAISSTTCEPDSSVSWKTRQGVLYFIKVTDINWYTTDSFSLLIRKGQENE